MIVNDLMTLRAFYDAVLVLEDTNGNIIYDNTLVKLGNFEYSAGRLSDYEAYLCPVIDILEVGFVKRINQISCTTDIRGYIETLNMLPRLHVLVDDPNETPSLYHIL